MKPYWRLKVLRRQFLIGGEQCRRVGLFPEYSVSHQCICNQSAKPHLHAVTRLCSKVGLSSRPAVLPMPPRSCGTTIVLNISWVALVPMPSTASQLLPFAHCLLTLPQMDSCGLGRRVEEQQAPLCVNKEKTFIARRRHPCATQLQRGDGGFHIRRGAWKAPPR